MERRPRRLIIWLSLFAAVLAGVALLGRHRRHGVPKRPADAAPTPRAVGSGSPASAGPSESENALAGGRGPLDFWGRVYDEVSARPVEGAQVAFHATDGTRSGHNADRHTTSDREGRFEMREFVGTSLNVSVTKDGYYVLPKRSEAFFEFGRKSIDPVMNWRPFPPNADEPVTFFLRRRGTPAALVHVEHQRGAVPRDGTPVTVQLTTGGKVPTGSGELVVRTWVYASEAREDHYDWLCVVSIPGGGLLPRRDVFDFEAPEAGYLPSDEITVARSRQEWSNDEMRRYFVKTADGCYARMDFRMLVGGQTPYYVLDVFLNLSGERNLGYSEKLTIHPAVR